MQKTIHQHQYYRKHVKKLLNFDRWYSHVCWFTFCMLHHYWTVLIGPNDYVYWWFNYFFLWFSFLLFGVVVWLIFAHAVRVLNLSLFSFDNIGNYDNSRMFWHFVAHSIRLMAMAMQWNNWLNPCFECGNTICNDTVSTSRPLKYIFLRVWILLKKNFAIFFSWNFCNRNWFGTIQRDEIIITLFVYFKWN